MPIADPYQATLRQALVDAVQTKLARDRRRATARRLVVAMAILAAVIATIVTVTLPNDRADASLEVEVRDGAVFVRLLDFESRPDEIVGALRNAGLDVEVEEAAVGPSNVGRFVGMTTFGGPGPKIVRDDRFAFMSFTVPQDFTGQLRLALGRRAAPGEQWLSYSDATAKGEALECRALRGLSAAEAARQLSDAPVPIRWEAVPGGALAPGAELGTHASWKVIDLVATSDHVVVVSLTTDGRWPYLTDVPPQVSPSCKGK